MDAEQRIANFRNMTEADPNNELGHFSLGRAYLDAGRDRDACASFRKVIQLQPGYSKAYQQLGETLERLGETQEAVRILKDGYRIAAERGDIIPRDVMGGLLKKLGQELPSVRVKAAPSPPRAEGADLVDCCRCGDSAPRLAEPPFKGAMGARIHAHVCQRCWREWVAMGTKVINELRLDFSNPMAEEMYDSHMREFLQLPA